MIERSKVTIKVRGTSPLLTHNPAGMRMSSDDPARKKKIPTPEEESEAGCYRDENGKYVLPSIGFRSAILAASKSFKKGRSSAFYGVSHIEMEAEWVPLKNGNGKAAGQYVIDTRRAVVQKNGILRSRPKWLQWSAEFTVIYDPALVNEKEIRTYAEEAGQKIGVFDYRPQRGGWFGRFELVD